MPLPRGTSRRSVPPPQKWFQDPGVHYLRLDAAGYPHIAYGGDHLYYTRYDGIGWRYETVDGAEHVGAGASLALDSEGAPPYQLL